MGGDPGNNKEGRRDKKYYSNDKFAAECCWLSYMNLTAPFQVQVLMAIENLPAKTCKSQQVDNRPVSQKFLKVLEKEKSK